MVNILVTNDDGIDAEGIQRLAQGLRDLKLYNIVVVAPTRERSATSHSLTLHRPLRIVDKSQNVYAVDGTPTDCVILGYSKILKKKPDLIVIIGLVATSLLFRTFPNPIATPSSKAKFL